MDQCNCKVLLEPLEDKKQEKGEGGTWLACGKGKRKKKVSDRVRRKVRWRARITQYYLLF